ncbi:MAG: energy-coupling factor ABC transporter ATP-binding protein [Acidobacteriota bacterium]
MDPVYEVKGLAFGYPGSAPCLRDLTLTVARGERLALAGANGCGKTTLLLIMAGLLFPTSGTVAFEGQPLSESVLEAVPFGPRFRRSVGFLFQNPDSQLFCPTVKEELAFGPLQLKLPQGEVEQRVEDCLGLMRIAHLRDRPPHALSAGEKKRVALASLLVLSPSVLLLDEPTAGLDPRNQSALVDLLGELAQAGLTLVTATHDMILLPHLADRLLVLGEDHRVAREGPVKEILADEDFLQSANLIHEHRHRHGPVVHSHPHSHGHTHDHGHDPDRLKGLTGGEEA